MNGLSGRSSRRSSLRRRQLKKNLPDWQRKSALKRKKPNCRLKEKKWSVSRLSKQRTRRLNKNALHKVYGARRDVTR